MQCINFCKLLTAGCTPVGCRESELQPHPDEWEQMLTNIPYTTYDSVFNGHMTLSTNERYIRLPL
ncbi:hypothetical protein C0J52_01331 [Blattella germanica]|nr:hypothetical protein C0J52_01331 [Blattella germanica]